MQGTQGPKKHSVSTEQGSRTVVKRRNTSDQEILGKEAMHLPPEIASHPESERVSSRETMTTNAARMWVEDRRCWWTRKLRESL